MADKSPIQCPLCGNKVPPGVTKCPVCATVLKGVPEQVPRGGRLDRPSEDFLHREIPRVVLPESKHTCPLCALELKGRESKCPRCGVPLALPKDEEMLACPECGALAPFGSKSCPKCGIGFEEVPGPPPIEELPPPPEPVAPERPIERKAPLPPPPPIATQVPPGPPPQSKGLTNGRGAINGTGLVNGTGMINGTKGEGRAQARANQRKMFITRWQFLAVLIALVVVIPTFLYLSYVTEPSEFAIDGDFGEWSHVEKFGMYVQASSAPIAVSEWAVSSEGSNLFLYVSAQGAIMGSVEVNSFYLLVDTDGSATTGYQGFGIGAEYLLEIDGWNGSVQSTSLSEYAGSADKYNWNAWNSVNSPSALVSGSELEARADMPFELSPSSRFVLTTQDSMEQSSVSYSVPERGGLLIVEMEPGADIELGGLVAKSASVSFMKVFLTCEGESGTVQSLTPAVTGASLVSSVEDLSFDAGDELMIEILVDTSLSSVESVVTASIAAANVVSTFSDIQFIGDDVRAYVVSAPSEIRIDGAFADWDGIATTDADSVLNANDNIDMSAVGAVNGTAYSAFYVSVEGDMCGGSFIPIIKEKPSGSGGGGGGPLPRKTGEDILRIYIDTDLDNTTGQVVTLSSKVIGADYMIEVKGVNGVIATRALKEYSAGQWSNPPGTINVAKDRQRLELNVTAGSIGGATSFDFIVETTDWRQRTDLATAVPIGGRSLVGGLPSGASILSWPIESPTTSASATAMSYQRKQFYDGVNYWSFYYDGANTVYRYSTDGGRTWSATSRAFSTNGVNEASVWFDSATNTVYVVGDRAAASTNVRVRQGTVSPTAHTISWSSNDYAPVVSSFALGGKNTYISKDRAGYLWLMTSNCTQFTPTRYDLTIFRSALVNSTQDWVFSGNTLLGATQAQPNMVGSVVNIGSGSDMLAVYAYQGNVASRTLTTSWSAETLIYAIGGGNPGNTDNAPPSVTVDGNGVAHVVYGNGHQQAAVSLPYIYYVYYRGSGWSVPYRLDSQKNSEGCFYPTISVDASTGNIFAFWLDTVSAVGTIIEAKKNVTGTWVSFSGSSDTTSPKQYLTSVFSAPTESQIFWQWTQNTTGTIEIEFDGLPEFSDVLLPVLGMTAIFFLGYRSRTGRRRKRASEE